MFLFVVRHLRWLTRVPLMPQLFDAWLLAWTCLAHRTRLAAMETLEARALAVPGVRLRVHRLGGVEFVRDGRELGHLHGNGLLDTRVARETAESLVAAKIVRAHHVFLPRTGWVSFQIEIDADVPKALELLLGIPGRQSRIGSSPSP